MKHTFIELIKMILPLSKKKKKELSSLSLYLSKSELKTTKKLLKQNLIWSAYTTENFSKSIGITIHYPLIFSDSKEQHIISFVESINEKIKNTTRHKEYALLSKKAYEIIPNLIAPEILGFENLKKAIAIQLLSKERIHILLLGDPSTGKTDLIRAAYELSPIGSFGLGSGISGVGLSMSISGKEVIKGLLPLANKGICAIDELNLIKQDDLGSLYNAMEKGFVSYDKGNTHKTLDADVRVIATANPKGKIFVGKDIKYLRTQVKFDPALLSRFHLISIIRRPKPEEFAKIASSLASGKSITLSQKDKNFIKGFIDFAKDIQVDFPSNLEGEIEKFAKEIREKEDNMVIDSSPRQVIGVIRMAKALARMRLSNNVSPLDLSNSIELFKSIMIEHEN